MNKYFIYMVIGYMFGCTMGYLVARWRPHADCQKQIAILAGKVVRIESFRDGFLEGKKALVKQQEDLGVIITQVPRVQK